MFVLELGCGKGKLSNRLNAKGLTLIGIDNERKKVLKAKLLKANPRGYFDVVQCDAFNLPFKDDSFDMILVPCVTCLFTEDDTIHSSFILKAIDSWKHITNCAIMIRFSCMAEYNKMLEDELGKRIRLCKRRSDAPTLIFKNEMFEKLFDGDYKTVRKKIKEAARLGQFGMKKQKPR